MNAAQLGLEPNTPLGQAYLIPYKNKGKPECQFQTGYKGINGGYGMAIMSKADMDIYAKPIAKHLTSSG